MRKYFLFFGIFLLLIPLVVAVVDKIAGIEFTTNFDETSPKICDIVNLSQTFTPLGNVSLWYMTFTIRDPNALDSSTLNLSIWSTSAGNPSVQLQQFNGTMGSSIGVGGTNINFSFLVGESALNLTGNITYAAVLIANVTDDDVAEPCSPGFQLETVTAGGYTGGKLVKQVAGTWSDVGTQDVSWTIGYGEDRLQPLPPVGTDTLNFTDVIYPPNSTIFGNNSVTFYGFINSSYLFNVTLLINDTSNITKQDYSAGTNVRTEFNITFGAEIDRWYNYSFSAVNGNETEKRVGKFKISTVTDPLNLSSAIFPTNNTQYNKNTLNFNITTNLSVVTNITLYINNTLNQSKSVSAGLNQYVEFNVTLPSSRTYSWNINLTNQSATDSTILYKESTEVRIIHIDPTIPTLETSFSGGRAFFGNTLFVQFNLTDEFQLFDANIYIDNVLNFSLSEINASARQINFSTNLSILQVGVHYLNITFSDGHTSKAIEDFQYSRNILTKSIKYEFDDDYIKIYPKESTLFESFDTYKNTDRYAFTYDRSSNRKEQTFVVESSRRISILDSNKFKGWLVVDELDKWLDFEAGDNYRAASVLRINDKEVEVTLSGITKEDLTFNSIGSLNTISRRYSFFTGNVTTILTTPVVETEFTNFTALFEINTSYIDNIVANFSWNGTNIAFDESYNTSKHWIYSKYLTIPQIDASTSVITYWNYTIVGKNNSETNSTANQSQIVFDITISGCNETAANATLVISTWDEETLTRVQNVSVKATFGIEVHQFNTTQKNLTFDFPNNFAGPSGSYNYSICVNPFSERYLTDAFIDYKRENSDYFQRNYFLSRYSLGNNTKSLVDLYLINSTKATSSTITVVDENNDALNNRFVKVQRYYPGENVFRTVEVARTSTDGKGLVRLVLNDIWYKFVVDDTNRTVFISENQKVTTSSLFLQVQLTDSFLDNIEKIDNLEYLLSYNNATGVFSFFWNDNKNIVREGCLSVRNGSINQETVCDSCIAAISGTITCSINSSTKVRHMATGYIKTTSQFSEIVKALMEINPVKEFKNFGVAGLLIQLLLMGTLVGLGIWNPSVALIFGGLSVIVGAGMGIIGLSGGSIIVIITLIGVTIGLLRD